MRRAARARQSAAPRGTRGAGGGRGGGPAGRGAGHLTSCFPARGQTQLCGGISLPSSVPLSPFPRPPLLFASASPPPHPAFLLLQENNLTVDLLTGEEFASWIKKKKKKAERSLGTVARGG